MKIQTSVDMIIDRKHTPAGTVLDVTEAFAQLLTGTNRALWVVSSSDVLPQVIVREPNVILPAGEGEGGQGVAPAWKNEPLEYPANPVLAKNTWETEKGSKRYAGGTETAAIEGDEKAVAIAGVKK